MEKPKDHTLQLSDYILNNLNKGYTLDSLRHALKEQGYSRISIDEDQKTASQKEDNNKMEIIPEEKGFLDKISGD